MFAIISPLSSVQASGSVAAQTSSVIDLSSWSNVSIAAQTNGAAAGTGSLWVSNTEGVNLQPSSWVSLVTVTVSGSSVGSTSTTITPINFKWGQVRWVNSSSASGSLATVSLALNDRGTK